MSFGTSRPLASFRSSSRLCWRRRHRTCPRWRWHHLQWGRRNQTGSSTSNSLAEYQQQRAEELSPARTRAVLMYVDVDGAEDIPIAETLDTPIIAREALADVASAACPLHLTLPRHQVRPQHLTSRTRTRLRALMPQVEARKCDSLSDVRSLAASSIDLA